MRETRHYRAVIETLNRLPSTSPCHDGAVRKWRIAGLAILLTVAACSDDGDDSTAPDPCRFMDPEELSQVVGLTVERQPVDGSRDDAVKLCLWTAAQDGGLGQQIAVLAAVTPRNRTLVEETAERRGVERVEGIGEVAARTEEGLIVLVNEQLRLEVGVSEGGRLLDELTERVAELAVESATRS